MARKAFEACLMISAALVEVCRIGGRYSGVAMAGDGIGTLVVAAGSEWLVNGGQQSGRVFAVGAEDNSVRMEKILDRGAFAQEFGIRGHVKERPRDAIPFDGASDPVIGIDRHRALLNDDLIRVNRTGNLAGHRVYVGQIGVAGLALGASLRQ